ncbi:MAG: PAS domain S-box protein [Burkholderiaceae bacterium]
MNAQQSSTRFRWLVIGPFVIVVALLATLGLASAQVLSAVRAYVGGESLWSKGQKDAVYHLAHYAESRRPVDHARFAEAIAVPLGDRLARTELDRPAPDLALARIGLLQGGNHPDDIDAMIWLFRTFRHVPFMADAIAIWAEADAELEALNQLGERLHRRIASGSADAAPMRVLLVEMADVNDRLTLLEQRFSATMGAASRSAQRLVQWGTLVLAIALVAAALSLSFALLRRQAVAAAALRASEQRFRLLWQTAPDAIVVFDEHLRIRYANAAVQALFGHAADELIGADVGLLHPEADRQTHRQQMARQVSSGASELNARRIVMTGLHRDGRRIPLEVAFSHVEHEGEHQFAGFLRDISTRERVAQALRASEERLQRALDASSLCLWDFDVASGKIYLSESWSQWLGGPAQVTLTTFAELTQGVPESERKPLLAAVHAVLKDPNSTYRVEHSVRKLDGSWLWNLSVGRVVERDAHGRAVRMVGTNRDITERKLAEATQAGLEAQLRESQKMEAIGTLAAGIAHDFNNILGAILGNLALAREEVGPAHASLRSLEQINKSAVRARTLVQQILAFGRRQPQELINRPLGPLVEETLALMRATLPAGVSLESQLTPARLNVLANATHMQQVLMNLCTNAWHALQGRAGRIVVGLAAVELASDAGPRPGGLAPGHYAHLWVTDSGCGMNAETRARIFEPFFTTKPVGQGTGLGLSVVHGIVAAHHGAITVDSAPDFGSTFHLYLPHMQAQALPPPSEWGGLAPLQRQVQGDGQHVLYIDDDPVMLLLVERLLLRLGYRVTAQVDARTALDALRAQPHAYDLVVSDFNMPDVSGLDVVREVAQIRPGLPVVISSGHLTDEQRAELLRCGVRDIVSKASTLEELGPLVSRRVIRHALA